MLLWIGSPSWAPWHGNVFHQGVWLDNSFLFGRNLAALIFFWGLAARYLNDRRKGRERSRAPGWSWSTAWCSRCWGSTW